MRQIKRDDVAAERHIPSDGFIIDVVFHRVVNGGEMLGGDFLGKVFKRGIGSGLPVFQRGAGVFKIAAVVAENLAA